MCTYKWVKCEMVKKVGGGGRSQTNNCVHVCACVCMWHVCALPIQWLTGVHVLCGVFAHARGCEAHRL